MEYKCLILLAMLISSDRLAAAAEAVKTWGGRYFLGALRDEVLQPGAGAESLAEFQVKPLKAASGLGLCNDECASM